ncbi:peroxiredoxin [Actinopolyspora halophila]|uniref:peroxiredoxin n=1 Tax=Actinopolyspora halophila TaxID=1850 RepID=UPI00036D4A97|nr:peroxiredoxin [Actinopolyspora halophila]
MQSGELAPDFELADQHGTPRSLSGLLTGGVVVLFFYPAALAAGCGAENRHFRDLANRFATLGAQPVGISPAPVDEQSRFAAENSLGFPLLSDGNAEVAREFGVRRGFGPLPVKRHTFVLDRDRRVLHVIRSEFRTAAHADRTIEFLRARS